jgi:DNA-binding transcriptional LysR family regulator
MDLLEQMTTFVRIVDAGSLAAAARQLRLSPAAVSRQLSALETQIGVPLLLRSTRHLAVTDVGREYYGRCLRILREVDDAQTLARTGQDTAGLLRVSAPVTFGLARIAPLLPGLLAAHRALRIDLRLEDRIIDLVGDGVDVAIRTGIAPPDSDALVAHVLQRYGRVVVGSPAYLQRAGEPTEPEALARHQLLQHLPGGGTLGRWSFEREGRQADVVAEATLRSNALAAIQQAAIAGAGLALLPDWLVGDAVAAGHLRVILRDWRTAPVTVFALHRAELRGAARVRTFVEWIRRALGPAAPSAVNPDRRPAR